jgi:hypothetical protein
MTLGIPTLAQTLGSRPTNSAPQAQGQSSNQSPDDNSIGTVASEIGLLRKSLQTLNTRLREISEKLLAPDSTPSKEQRNPISRSLELLGQAEQRAEGLRKQLFEMIERETSYKNRLVQLDEDMRPENIERASSLAGSTRTLEVRDARRRVLDNERKGYESLLRQASESRLRLEDDVRQADAFVSRLRQRLFPLIEKEIDKLNPN